MKVLIIGLGSIAKKHINAIKLIDDKALIYALRSGYSAIQVENVINFYDDNEVNRIKPDFCIISNPSSNHYEAIKKVIEFKIPLFIEKPIFIKIGTLEKDLVTKILESNLPNYVACNLRFLNSLKELKKIVRKERINEVNVYCGSYLPEWRPEQNYKTIYSAIKEMGGGVHLDLIHELDYTYWMFGTPLNTYKCLRNTSSLEIETCDYANYVWQYETFTASIILNYYRQDAKRSLEIITSDNIYVVDLFHNTICQNNQLVYQSDQRITETYYEQLKFYVENILEKKTTFNQVDEAYKVLELCINS